MTNLKVSIVLPVYNGEKSIENAIKSVCEQNYPGLELIVVNDGSTDGTAGMIDKYAGFNYVKIFHQKNKGVSAARNKGLKESTGDYVLFIDADDSMTKYSLEKLNRYLLEHPGTDIAVFGWNEILPDGSSVTKIPDIPDVLDKYTCIKSIITTDYGCGGGYPWNKIWRRSCIMEVNKSVYFNETLVLCEDKEWTVRTLLNVNKVGFINQALYNYTIQEGEHLARIDFDEVSDKTNEKIKSFLRSSISISSVLNTHSENITLSRIATRIMAQDIIMVYFKCKRNKNRVLEDYVSKVYIDQVENKRIKVGLKYDIMKWIISLDSWYNREK